jgi:hypothetical protein
MPDGRFESLRLELLRGGVSRYYVERTIAELNDHYDDLVAVARAAGLTPAEAEQEAQTALGEEHAIARAILAHREALAFGARWPRVAQYLNSAVALGALPGAPLVFCLEHRPELTRWGAAVGAAATLMGGMMAMLHWLIVVPY